MNKKGQFFLLAAMVIIGVAYGLSLTYTSIEAPPQSATIYDLTNEIKFEANTVLDKGIFDSDYQLEKNITALLDYYAQKKLESDLVIVYGDKSSVNVVLYETQNTGGIGISFGSTSTIFSQGSQRKQTLNGIDAISETEITIVLTEDDNDNDQEIKYTFEIKPGQMFYIVIKEERGADQFFSAS